MKKFSLRKRLIAAVVSSQFLLAVALVIVGTSFSRYYLRRAFDMYLQGRAESVAAIAYYPDDGSPGLKFNRSRIPQSPPGGPEELFWVFSSKGDFEQHTAGVDPRIFKHVHLDSRFSMLRFNERLYRAIVLQNVAVQDTKEGIPLPLPTLTVVYAAPTGSIEHQITMLGVAVGIVGLVVLAPTLWMAIWSMEKALAPLDDLATAASAISVNRWNFEPSEEAQATLELQPLIRAITVVLAGLKAAFKRQRDFMSDAAHELKTSLAILKSTLQMLQSKPLKRGDYESGLAVMSRDSERLERLLNRMLQTARAGERPANGREMGFEPVDLAKSCEAAAAQLRQFAAVREVRVDFSAKGEAPIRADAADLELIWINLLENAIQYSPRGSVVTMTLTVLDGTVSVEVADRGCGIDHAHLPFIFERFYRADLSRARVTGGFGLGLAIAKSLVESCGGRICAESEPGHGTQITVAFPLEAGLETREMTEHEAT